jgi:hypothetical protein
MTASLPHPQHIIILAHSFYKPASTKPPPLTTTFLAAFQRSDSTMGEGDDTAGGGGITANTMVWIDKHDGKVMKNLPNTPKPNPEL